MEVLGFEAQVRLRMGNLRKPPCKIIEFDDLETFEHTKCKPLSVTIAVEFKTRRILGLEVSTMPARGLLVEKAKKYGYRKDTRGEARERLFKTIAPLLEEGAVIKSDSNPHYPPDVARFFPKSAHKTYLGRKPKSSGQGELKQGPFDPLFSLNHTCAMFRANVNRLIRHTWCTTKNRHRLRDHLLIYADYHNEHLTLV